MTFKYSQTRREKRGDKTLITRFDEDGRLASETLITPTKMGGGGTINNKRTLTYNKIRNKVEKRQHDDGKSSALLLLIIIALPIMLIWWLCKLIFRRK